MSKIISLPNLPQGNRNFNYKLIFKFYSDYKRFPMDINWQELKNLYSVGKYKLYKLTSDTYK